MRDGIEGAPEARAELFARAGQWYAVYTKRQSEHIARDALVAAGFVTYLPLRRVQIRLYRERRDVVERPLFPRYLFAAIADAGDFLAMRSAQGVDSVLCADPGRPQVIRPQVLAEIMTAQWGGAFDRVPAGDPMFRGGDKVRIMTGPLAEVVGLIRDAGDGDDMRSMVLFKLLGREHAVKIPIDNLQRIT